MLDLYYNNVTAFLRPHQEYRDLRKLSLLEARMAKRLKSVFIPCHSPQFGVFREAGL